MKVPILAKRSVHYKFAVYTLFHEDEIILLRWYTMMVWKGGKGAGILAISLSSFIALLNSQLVNKNNVHRDLSMRQINDYW